MLKIFLLPEGCFGASLHAAIKRISDTTKYIAAVITLGVGGYFSGSKSRTLKAEIN